MKANTANLILSDITKTYPDAAGPVNILRGITLTVEPGSAVAVVGPSGSGKSTLLNIIGSLDKPTSGTVHLGEVSVTALEGKALAEFRANQVGFVFQDHHLLPQLTALENVLLPTIPAGNAHSAEDRARALLDRMGIAKRADAFPGQMSGGERQRTSVARALINGAKLLLCDEPTGSLDSDTGSTLVSLLLELAEQQKTTVILVTHNAEHAARCGIRLMLHEGRLVSHENGG
jgi:ABC-type lipoprotein export system ATPase subunit